MEQLAAFLLILGFFWAAHRLLQRAPGGRTAERWVKRFFSFSLLTPAKRRGAFFGLWHFLFWFAILSTAGLLIFPSDDGARGVIVLWAIVLVGRFLLSYTPHLSHPHTRRPLPSRHRRR